MTVILQSLMMYEEQVKFPGSYHIQKPFCLLADCRIEKLSLETICKYV